MSIQIIPAIDLKGGRCVRLRQGLADQETVYGADPLEMARRWVGDGATFLHLVDLDGAFQGRPVHTQIIGRIAREAGVPVEAGGGLREPAHIESLLQQGVNRVILGTRAVSDPHMLRALVRDFGDRIAVGIDARDGKVQVRGWVETTNRCALDLAAEAESFGVRTIIFTDTATDGMLTGINAAAMAAMCDRVTCQIVASGGVASAADIRALRALNRRNLVGAIVGKALYENATSVARLMAAAKGDKRE